MKKYPILLLLYIFSVSLFADFYDIRTFDPTTGLTGTYVYSLVQDHDGFLWVGTENGLFKYDGKKFEANFVKDSINDPFVSSFRSKENILYFGQLSGSIRKWDGRGFHLMDSLNESKSKVNTFVEASDGTIWALTQNNGLKSLKPGDSKFNQHMVAEIRGLVADCMGIYDDILFIGTSDGLQKFDVSDGTPKAMGSIKELDYVSVISIKARAKAKGFWVGTTDDGLYMLNVTGDKSGKFPDRAIKTQILPNHSIVAIDEAENRDLWLGTKYDGLYKINFNYDNSIPVQYSHYTKKNGFAGNEIGTLFIDQERTTWCGTVGQGLAQMLEKSLHFFPFKTLGVDEVNGTLQNSRHEYFFATNNGMIKGYYPEKSDSLRFMAARSDFFEGMEITSIGYDYDSTFIIGTATQGIFRSDDQLNKVKRIPVDINFATSPIRDIKCDQKGNIWVSVSGFGIYKFDREGKELAHYSTSTGFYHNEIYSIQADRHGNIWSGAHSAGLAIIKVDGTFDLLTKKGIFPSRDINDICVDKEGFIWVATHGNGVFKYTGEEFEHYTIENGLLSNYCNSIIADFDGHIWVGHRQGLSRLDKHTNSITNLTSTSGLTELSFIQGSAFSDRDHNIWLGNRNGVTYLAAPHESFSYKQLETHIMDVRLFYEEIDLWEYTKSNKLQGDIPDGIRFEHDQHDLTFDFIAVNLRNPHQNLYQYKLIGYESDWSPALPQTSMTYTNLDPGKYTFEVRQSDNVVYWSDENIVRASFEIKPPYWQTWWFSSSEVLFLVMLVFTTVFFARRISNKGVIKFLVYISLFIIFEYIHTQLEPYLEDVSGGAPIFQVMMHALLAFVLFPVESYSSRYLQKRSDIRDQQRLEHENELEKPANN